MTRLPEFGEWEGPVFGELGVLATDGEKVLCHACGRAFANLAQHARQTHHLQPEEYKAIFGLNRLTGLVGPAFAEHLRQRARRVLQPYWAHAVEALRARTPDQRRPLLGQQVRLEAKRNPRNQQLRREAARRSAQRNHERYLAGEWRPPRPHDPSAPGRASQQRRRELVQDPSYRAWLSRRISEGLGGRVAVACATCGAEFELPRARARAGRRRFCGPACLRAFQHARGLELGRTGHTRARRVTKICPVCGETFTGTVRRLYCSRACKAAADHRGGGGLCAACGQPFVGDRGSRFCSRTCASRANSAGRRDTRAAGYAEVAARLRALGPTSLEDLPEPYRQAIGLYYGLVTGASGRLTQAEVAARLDLPPRRGRDLIALGVAALLGPAAAGLVPRDCTACGRTFTPTLAWPGQRTCGEVCRRERRRQNGLATSPAARPDIRAKLSEAGR